MATGVLTFYIIRMPCPPLDSDLKNLEKTTFADALKKGLIGISLVVVRKSPHIRECFNVYNFTETGSGNNNAPMPFEGYYLINGDPRNEYHINDLDLYYNFRDGPYNGEMRGVRRSRRRGRKSRGRKSCRK